MRGDLSELRGDCHTISGFTLALRRPASRQQETWAFSHGILLHLISVARGSASLIYIPQILVVVSKKNRSSHFLGPSRNDPTVQHIFQVQENREDMRTMQGNVGER